MQKNSGFWYKLSAIIAIGQLAFSLYKQIDSLRKDRQKRN
ncbi:hypothetical protein LDI01_24280 [Lentilactobacillus diolivorans]|uniref:Uncharacterized protein n=1 Tax=Lentilactobacillus diolivorans TaxID=179838 RepID=A0ABQ0XFZ8_9LACO|nr:hypothetical protein LDI01_24280 [Lentilactobacillus diolivorans]